MNRILPRKSGDTTLNDLRKFVMEEMKVLYPVGRGRDNLFENKQKGGQTPSEFYLEFKDLALDCKLESMGKESLLGHLLL